MHLARFPRYKLAHLPTPLEYLENLTRQLGGPEIWIKRDDCTGLSTGGNKTRKLEFLMGEALQEDADIVLTQGATQSNHARQTAAFAARMGLECSILLEDRTAITDAEYVHNGNVFLDLLHGATIERYPLTSDMNGELENMAARLRTEGRKPYVIPGGGSNATGALGYVNAALELVTQCNDIGLRVDHVVHATGSAGTQAGLITGLAGTNSGIPLLGIGVRAAREAQEAMVFKVASETADKLDCSGVVGREQVIANCDYVGPGYGLPAVDTIEAIRMLAKLEGILLDPVYSGKGMAGLIDLCRKGFFQRGQHVVFVHTGGAAALPAYTSSFALQE